MTKDKYWDMDTALCAPYLDVIFGIAFLLRVLQFEQENATTSSTTRIVLLACLPTSRYKSLYTMLCDLARHSRRLSPIPCSQYAHPGHQHNPLDTRTQWQLQASRLG